jgi:ABC-2 type transport system permease protein
MFNLIKYELRSTFLTIVGICVSVIVASLFLMTKKNSWDVAVTGLSICLTIAAIIVIVISSLKIMSKYLHGDEGYLLFTLPQSGTTIMISRLITALIQISIVAFVSIFMCYFTVSEKLAFSFLKDINISLIIYGIIQYICSIVSFLTFIYFCMVIGKVALKGKKLGKVGSFIIFIILSSLISWLSFKISILLPQEITLFGSSIADSFKTSTSGFSISGGSLSINIAQSIFDVITFIGFFIGASYLIDNKLDLS